MMSGVPRRALGGLILALSTLPIFRVLDAGVEAPFRETKVRVAEATLEFVTWGAVTVILLGVGLARFLPT